MYELIVTKAICSIWREVLSLFTIAQVPDVDFSKNPYADGKFKFNDQTLVDEISTGNKVYIVSNLNRVCTSSCVWLSFSQQTFRLYLLRDVFLYTLGRFTWKDSTIVSLTCHWTGTWTFLKANSVCVFFLLRFSL